MEKETFDGNDIEVTETETSEQQVSEETEKPHKWRKPLLITLGGIAGTTAAVYIGTAAYFYFHCLPNTEINGKDFSYANRAEIEGYLKEDTKNYVLEIKGRENVKDQIQGSEIGVEYEADDAAGKLLREQNFWLWPVAFDREQTLEIPVSVSYDKEKLKEKISTLNVVTGEQTQPASSTPFFDGEKFVPGEEGKGTAVDVDTLNEVIGDAVSHLTEELELDDTGCYVRPKYIKDSPEVQAACDQMNPYLKARITYEMDEPVVVDGTVISQWVTADENFAVTFHPELVQEWLKQFAEKYDTVGKTRTFTTADGRSAQVSGGTYGWEIDEESELTALLANIENGDTVSREPAYVEGKTAISHGASDWGTTYAEVDLTNQKMWYVRDGQILMSTDIVTGLPTRARQTPEGVYTILERMRNKTLRGALKPDGTYEYETPVDYWMRVTYSGVGFHDATWQRTFGGDVYTYRGSHGCINMSYSDAGQLYDLIQVGVRSTKQSVGIKMLRTVDSHELADKNSKRYEIVMRNRLKRTDKEVERRWTKEN